MVDKDCLSSLIFCIVCQLDQGSVLSTIPFKSQNEKKTVTGDGVKKNPSLV